jgi:hypothetical protein
MMPRFGFAATLAVGLVAMIIAGLAIITAVVLLTPAD